jgi:hypothetical protein
MWRRRGGECRGEFSGTFSPTTVGEWRITLSGFSESRNHWLVDRYAAISGSHHYLKIMPGRSDCSGHSLPSLSRHDPSWPVRKYWRSVWVYSCSQHRTSQLTCASPALWKCDFWWRNSTLSTGPECPVSGWVGGGNSFCSAHNYEELPKKYEQTPLFKNVSKKNISFKLFTIIWQKYHHSNRLSEPDRMVVLSSKNCEQFKRNIFFTAGQNQYNYEGQKNLNSTFQKMSVKKLFLLNFPQLFDKSTTIRTGSASPIEWSYFHWKIVNSLKEIIF